MQATADIEQRSLISLKHLENKLKEARQEEHNGIRSSEIAALQAVIEFINSIPELEQQTLALPLVRLLSALNDLDLGRQVALLTPTQFDNRPPEPGARAVIKAYSVHAVDCLMRARPKEKLDDACKFVAEILSDAGIPSGGRANTPYWKTIKGWRSDRSRRSAHRQFTDTYEALSRECQYPETMPPTEIKKQLKILLLSVVRQWSRGLE